MPTNMSITVIAATAPYFEHKAPLTYSLCSKGAKAGLISENFSLWFKSPKNVLNHYSERYQPKVAQDSFWLIFCEM